MRKSRFLKIILFIILSSIVSPLSLVMAAETYTFDINTFTGKTVDDIMNEIVNEQCPCKLNFSCNKAMPMPKIFKTMPPFDWDGTKPLVFPAKQKYNEYKTNLEKRQRQLVTIILKDGSIIKNTINLSWEDPVNQSSAKKYSQLSLRLIPHHILNIKFDQANSLQRSFLDGYLYSIYKLMAFNNYARGTGTIKITPEIVAAVFIKLAECCNPPVNPNIIPKDLNSLKALIDDADNSTGRLSKRVDCTDLNLNQQQDCQ
jgi:hypothetical protein